MPGAADTVDTTGAPPAIRAAALADRPVLDALIARSARDLSCGHYSADEIERLVEHVFGVDSALLADGTYLVAEVAGVPAGCGGWSRRQTLFGGDRFARRDSRLLDPAVDAARIRAFFVDPAFARRGIASALLRACEAAAASAGFMRLELMATLPGVPLYSSHGFQPGEPVSVPVAGAPIRFVPMRKMISRVH